MSEQRCPTCGTDLKPPSPPSARRHMVKVDIDWGGSGRDGDPWVMQSWNVIGCECDRPWRHAHLA